MSDTPKTDALREVIVGQYKEDELTGNGMGNLLAALTDIETLERERECECKCDVDWPEEYYELRQRLERERDEARQELENYKAQSIHTCHDQCQRPMCVLRRERDAERALAEMYRRKYSRLTGEHEAIQEQLDAAIMLGKLQERRHERDLEELIAAAKAVIDRWETPFWKEAAHTGAYIAALRKAVEIAEGGHL